MFDVYKATHLHAENAKGGGYEGEMTAGAGRMRRKTLLRSKCFMYMSFYVYVSIYVHVGRPAKELNRQRSNDGGNVCVGNEDVSKDDGKDEYEGCVLCASSSRNTSIEHNRASEPHLFSNTHIPPDVGINKIQTTHIVYIHAFRSSSLCAVSNCSPRERTRQSSER